MTAAWLTADWVAAIAAVLAVAVPLLWGVFVFRGSLKQAAIDEEERRYAELDRLHFELLRMRVENSNLAPSAFSRPTTDMKAEAARREYECLVWSFIESILDYCAKPGRNFDVWVPAVKYEAQAYRSWLSPENLRRFEPNFVSRVERLIANYEIAHSGGPSGLDTQSRLGEAMPDG